MDKKVQREILVFLSNKIRHNERRKNISEAKRSWRFLALCDAMDEIEGTIKPPESKCVKQGGALLKV